MQTVLVEQYVGGHEHRVGEQAQRAVLVLLVLVLRHDVEPALGRQTAQNPLQLRVLTTLP